MTYLYCFAALILLALAFFTNGCIGSVEKKLIAIAPHNGHTMSIEEHTHTVGLGAYAHGAHLFFDKREVGGWNHNWPIQPEEYPNWMVKTFSEAPDSWTVCLSPAKFSRSDFDQLVACYEANKASVDADLKAKFTLYDTERFQVIGRFIYGEAPQPTIFQPTALRYQPFVGFGFTDKVVISQEEIVVQPDGKWRLEMTQTEAGHSQGVLSLEGRLTLEGGRLYFSMPPNEHWAEMPGTVRADAVSREAYLRGFTDGQGHRLDTVFEWKN